MRLFTEGVSAETTAPPVSATVTVRYTNQITLLAAQFTFNNNLVQ